MRPLLRHPRSRAPSRPGGGRELPTSTFRSARTNAATATSPRSPASTIWPTDTWLRSSARSRLSSSSPRKSTPSSWAEERPPGSIRCSLPPCAAVIKQLVHSHRRRRVDGRGKPRNDRRRESRCPGRSRGRPHQPGRPIISAEPARGPRARARPRPGRVGSRRRPSAVCPLVARPDLRSARLDPGAMARRPGNCPFARPFPSLVLRPGLREGHAALEPAAKRPGRALERGNSSGRCTRPPSIGWAKPDLTMYEISNFARPGEESRHNLVYWANDAYFGFGVGAARYARGVRSTNTRDLAAYLRRVEAGRKRHGPARRAQPGRARTGNRDADAAANSGRHRARRLSVANRLRPRLALRQRDRAVRGAGVPGRRWTARPTDRRKASSSPTASSAS